MRKMQHQLTAFFLLTGFLLGVRADRLTLWRDDDPQPIAVFPCVVSSLPVADQCLLRRGIPAEDEQALARLLEDYL